MSTKQERLDYARTTFKQVSPHGWTETSAYTTAQGGHSGVCVVENEEGHQGVFRCLLADATDAMKKRFYRELEIVPQMNHKNIMRIWIAPLIEKHSGISVNWEYRLIPTGLISERNLRAIQSDL